MALQLWMEAHRPRGLDDYVWRDLEMRATIEDWLAKKALPHCLFSGTQGTGKTSLALMLLDLLEIPQEDVLKINASRERKVDELQDKIINFIDAWAFNETGLKYIFLDECLEENEKIRMADGSSMRIGDMRLLETYAVRSLSLETGQLENDKAVVISRKEEEVFRVDLEDGRTITATLDHPFIVQSEHGLEQRKLCDLQAGDKIVTVIDDGEILRS